MKAVLDRLKVLISAMTTGSPAVAVFDRVTIGADESLLGTSKFCMIDENQNSETYDYNDRSFVKTLIVDISVGYFIPAAMDITIVEGLIDLCELVKAELLATPNIGITNVKRVALSNVQWTTEVLRGPRTVRIRTMTYEIQIIEAL